MAIGFLPSQPLEFNDFSGGLTDNILQGDANRYAIADNFLISTDKKIEVRPGTIVYDPTGYQISAGARVSGLFTGINESVLFAHSGRDLYTQKPEVRYGTAWSRILGPTGNEALGGGGNYAQVTTGDFQRQVYYTSDYGVQPGKVFRDHTATWKAVTAGLPKMAFTPNYPTRDSLVPACITLANNLRTSMIAHFTDVGVVGTGQHKEQDKWSLGYLQAVTWIIADPEYPGPAPIPTPALAATNEATLYTLCLALALAYEHHRNDLAGPTPDKDIGTKLYHHDIVVYPTGTSDPYAGGSGEVPSAIGLAAKMTLSGVLTSPYKTAAFLDELATKWYWHQLLPFSHAANNSYTVMSRHLLTASGNDSVKIGTVYQTPYKIQVTPNYGDFVAYAGWIKGVMNKHALATGSGTKNYHGQVDPYGEVTVPDPVDYDSAALNIFWARYLYGSFHVFDSNHPVHKRITFTTVAGSANISSVVLTSSGAAVTLPVDSWIVVAADTFNDANANNRRAARVMSSGSGTATLSRTAIANGSGVAGQYSDSWLHGAYYNGVLTNAACDTTASVALEAEFLQKVGSIGTDLSTWVQLGNEFLLALGAHEANGNKAPAASSHKQNNYLGNDLQGVSAANSNPFFVPTVVTLAWAGYYQYRYTVEPNGLIYQNRGAPVYSDSIQTFPSYPVGTIIASTNETYFPEAVIQVENKCATLAGVPALANTTLTNYDTTVSVTPAPEMPGSTGWFENLTIELFRTTSGGTTFYALETLVNATVNYTDGVNENYPRLGETALNLRPIIYTSGGVLANDQPPVAKFVHAFGGFMYYGAITDTGQFFPQRIRQSLGYEPDSAPATLYDDLEDELVGLSSTKNNLIAVCKSSLYRMSGSFTSTGQGKLTHDRVLDAMGGLNARSIVKTEIGVFYAGTDGFYYTDGYQVIKISLELDDTYQALTQSDEQKARIYGTYDKNTRRIWWAMQSSPSASDNDVFFIFYLNYGVKPSGVFTKALTTHSWQPSSVTFYKGKVIIGDTRGYLFKTDEYTKTDPLINTGVAPANWRTVLVPWKYRSCAVDMGTVDKRKWTTRIHAIGENVGDASIQISSINDLGRNPTGSDSTLPLAPIQYRKNLTWGDARVEWGDESIGWNPKGAMDVWRRFPSRSMRSDFKQIQYEPGDFVVYKSDDFPEFCFAAVNSAVKTATIATPTGYDDIVWPLDVIDYYIAFDTDNYEQKYLITNRGTDGHAIEYSDAGNLSVTDPAARWQISGVKKEQRVRITSFVITTSILGDEFEANPGKSEAGGMGGNA